ncbi:MAG TPA: tyrosine--tRNA ligase, partial [Bacteroidia bacterium]|nr:tyrosine--tRNA ligase [Bacteroidia bacterium]
QMGGSDQWGNIVTGTELIRRRDGGEAWALTTPLIKKADGTKFGKTEGGNVWLDPKRTSPYDFYQFWINAADADAGNYIRIFTLKGKEEIETIEAEHNEDPGKRVLQKLLAEDITKRVHGTDALNAVIDATAMFMAKNAPELIAAANEETFEKMIAAAGIRRVDLSAEELASGVRLVEILTTRSAMFDSNGDAMKMMKANGIAVNKVKATDPKMTLSASQLVGGKYSLVQKGRNDFCVVRVL